MTSKDTVSKQEVEKSNIPMNRWISLDTLTGDQLEVLMEGPFRFEWNLGMRHGRELMELRITPA